jgi:hypothetical protein
LYMRFSFPVAHVGRAWTRPTACTTPHQSTWLVSFRYRIGRDSSCRLHHSLFTLSAESVLVVVVVVIVSQQRKTILFTANAPQSRQTCLTRIPACITVHPSFSASHISTAISHITSQTVHGPSTILSNFFLLLG